MFILSLQVRKLTHRQDKKPAKITWPVSGRARLHIHVVSAAVAQGRLGATSIGKGWSEALGCMPCTCVDM